MWATNRGVSSALGGKRRDESDEEVSFKVQKRSGVDQVQSFRGAENGSAQEWMFAGIDRHTGMLGSRLYGVIYARVSSPSVIVPDAAPSWRSLEHLTDIYDSLIVNAALGRYEKASDFFEQTALPRGCVLLEAQNRVARVLRAYGVDVEQRAVAPIRDRPCCLCGVMGAAVGLKQCCFNPAYDLKEQECQFVVCGECRMKEEFQRTLAINLEWVRQQCPQCVSGGITNEPAPIVCPCHSPSEIIRAACIMRAR
jgi:hypothetical protein